MKLTLTSRRMLSVGDFEWLCRQSLARNPRKSCLPIQLAIEASMMDGWISASATCRTLLGRDRDFHFGSSGLDWLAEMRILKHCQLQSKQNGLPEHHMCATDSARTVDLDSIDGEHMLLIREDLKKFTHAHSSASPIVGLALSALHVWKLQSAADITRFIWPKGDVHTNSTKTLSRLGDLGMLWFQRMSGAGIRGQVFVNRLV